MNRNDYAHELLDLLSAPHDDANAWALVSWMQAEGGNATWNPLNTTRDAPGATDYNSVHVKNYPDSKTGLLATSLTIKQPNFEHILGALKDPQGTAKRVLRAVEVSEWGTGGLALMVLPYVKASYWKFARHTIAGS